MAWGRHSYQCRDPLFAPTRENFLAKILQWFYGLGMAFIRRKLKFGVPAELADAHPAVQQHVKDYEALVEKRERHVDVLERQQSATRDLLIKELGADHPLVTKVNADISSQNGLWIEG